MKGGNYIQRLIDGDDSALDDIYSSFRQGFISFAGSSLGLGREDAADLFQEACICLLVNVRRGKVTELENRQVQAYLYTTGRYIRMNRRRKGHLPLETAVWDDETGSAKIIENVPDTGEDPQEKEQRIQVVQDVVRSIPAPCSTLLELQFFHGKKQAEIAVEMGYESADSVKTMVSRCKGKVRTIVRQKYRELGL